MAKKEKRILTPVERAIKVKRAAIQRCENEIAWIQENADEKIAKVKRRIAVSRALLAALERGELKL